VRARSRWSSALVIAVAVVVLSGCDWSQFRFGPEHTGFNPNETKLNVANVSQLQQVWAADTLSPIGSSPAVVNGVAYVGSTNGKLYAFDAKGKVNCSGSPNTCAPLWTATTGGFVESSPAVANGIVFVGSDDGRLYAFDAKGKVNCAGTPKTCAPLWTASGAGSPLVANGKVYVTSFPDEVFSDTRLFAYDAKGTINCSGTPKTCAPLWTAAPGGVLASPAAANGIVYVASGARGPDSKLYAFDATGTVNCSGTPKTCAPLWTGTANVSDPRSGSPAVWNGVVYVSSTNNKLSAFDAAGKRGCSGQPKTCTPLWTTTSIATSDVSSPAVDPAIGNGIVYVAGNNAGLYAFDAAGNLNCSGQPKTCAPLGTGTAGTIVSSPAVANGVVYVGSSDDKLYAFDAAGALNCTASPPTCRPLWTATTNAPVFSSPAVVNGMVYVGSDDNHIYAYRLP
jgi:outer membrane protein assembly factor BamB